MITDSDGKEFEVYTDEDIKSATQPFIDRIKGLEDKDFSFEHLKRKMKEGEKLSEDQQKKYDQLVIENAKAQNEVKSWQDKMVDSMITDATKTFTLDEEEKKKLMYYFENDLNSVKAETPDQIAEKMEKAAMLSGLRRKTLGVYRAVNSSGVAGDASLQTKEKRYSETTDGQELSKRLGL